MSKAFSACLLALALGCQAQAHGTIASHARSIDGLHSVDFQDKKTVFCSAARPAQDTTKASPKRLLTASQVTLAARFQPASTQVETPAPVPAGSAEATEPAGTEFDLETANLPDALAITLRRPEAPLGRRVFRTRLVRTGRWASHPEAVEILTCTYAGPLVLAQFPATAATPSQLLAGPGYDPATPLRPLALTQEAVLRLCGDRAPQVRAYAMLYNLHFQQAEEVARLLDYYNRIAVVVK